LNRLNTLENNSSGGGGGSNDNIDLSEIEEKLENIEKVIYINEDGIYPSFDLTNNLFEYYNNDDG
jgi:hypothetical protein